MSREHHPAEPVPGRMAERSDPGEAGLGANWGWLLVQRDWSLRQREPCRGGFVAKLRRRVAGAAAWLRRLVRGAPGGAAQGPAR